jgi:hypothetical protein
MKTSFRTVALTAFAAGIIPAAGFAMPVTTHAATMNDLSTAQLSNLDTAEISVIKDDIKYINDEAALTAAQQAKNKLRSELDRDTATSYRDWDYDTPAVERDRAAYEAAGNKVSVLTKDMQNDTDNLETAANYYRGLLFDYGLPVPDVLPFDSLDQA